MDAVAPTSPWRSRFAREIALILVIKITLLLIIKMIWFSGPPASAEGANAHLFGKPAAATPHSPLTKEP